MDLFGLDFLYDTSGSHAFQSRDSGKKSAAQTLYFCSQTEVCLVASDSLLTQAN
jgi:hypothetical protein